MRCRWLVVVVESRGVGSAVTLRPNKDSARDAIVIGDPTNSVLADGVVSGWQIYAKIVSIEHQVFLQVSTAQPPTGKRNIVLYGVLCVGWLDSVLDSGAEGPGFKSQPQRCRVTVLGKLFTPIVFTKQQNW